MGELLAAGNHILCKNIQDLREYLDFALANAAPLEDKGYRLARQFTQQRLSESWLTLIGTLVRTS